MTRRLFLAPFGARDATEHLLKEALALVPGPDYREILYLAPSPRKLRDTELLFARLCGRTGFLPPSFRTLREYARDLHSTLGSSRRFRTELKPLLIRQLLTSGDSSEDLGATGEKTGGSHLPSIGYCQVVADFVRDIKLHAVTTDLTAIEQMVADLLDAYEKPKARVLEALRVFGKYNDKLGAKGWSDDEDILALAAGRVSAIKPVKVLLLDSFVAPSRLEQRLITTLVEHSETSLALCYCAAEDRTCEFGAGFIRFLETLSFSICNLEASHEHTGMAARSRPNPDSYPLYRFNTPEDEVTGIAHHIKQQCLAGSLDITRTVVAFPGINAMASLIARSFRECGIPTTIYPVTKLSASPPVITVLELLTALESGYERVATTAAFTSEFLPGLLRLGSDTSPLPRNSAAATLNRAAREAGIIKDRDAWRHLARSLEHEDATDFTLDLQQRIRQAIGIIEKTLSGTRSLGSYARQLKQLLVTVDFCHNLDPNEAAAQHLLKDRGELYDIFDSIDGFEADFGEQPADLSVFTKTIRYLIGLAQRTPERTPQGVLVLSLTETLGLTPEHLYIGSLTESNLPSRYSADPLIPDTLRRDLGLPDLNWHLSQERFHLERTRHSSPNPPWLSCHAVADGKPVLPTPFLDLKPIDTWPAAGLFSPREQQCYLGTISGRVPAKVADSADFTDDESALAVIALRFGPNRKLSVTGLEAYRACPYRFYVNRVLGLDSLPRPSLQVEPQQWGLIVHQALGLLYTHGTIPTGKLRQAALDAFDAVIGQFGLNRFWTEVTRRLFEKGLDDFVRCETELRIDGFVPAGTELSVEGQISPELLLRGRLDRLDSDGRRIRVLDYKTGSTPSLSAAEVTKTRTHLQLPVYCHLLNLIRPETTTDNMGIYSTREAKVKWLADENCTAAELIQTAVETAVETAAAIRAGRFPAEPAQRACDYCDLYWLCGRPRPRRGRR